MVLFPAVFSDTRIHHPSQYRLVCGLYLFNLYSKACILDIKAQNVMLPPFLSCLLWFNSGSHRWTKESNNLRNGHMFKRTVTMMLAAGTWY
jgi:hypothetical protein